MRLVIVESPFADPDPVKQQENIDYARMCLADCLRRGEAPFASHLLYTQSGVLNDAIPSERELGIRAGLFWGAQADATVVYTDRGISKGMKLGIETAVALGRPIEHRTLNLAPPIKMPVTFHGAK